MNLKKDCGCNKKQPKVEIPLKQFNQDPFEDLCGKDFEPWKAPVNPDCNYVDKRVHIDNHPDEEDLTEVISGEELVLKFKDKLYNPAAFSGMGRVFLRKNMVSKTLNCFTDQRNVLTNDMFLDDFGRPLDNTIFIVQYDYDLDNKFIIMPKDCILLFLGGSFSNGTLVLNNTLFLPQILDYDTFINCNVKGTFRTGQVFYHCNKISFFDGKDWLTLGTTQQKDIESLLADLQAQIDEIKAQLGGDYATKEELNALEINLQRQIDSINSKLPVDYIQDVVAGSGIQVTKNGKTVTITNTGGSGLNYAITDLSVNDNKLHLKQNNGIDQTVTLPTGGEPVTSDVRYTSVIGANTEGAYKLGTLYVSTNEYPIYGKDLKGGDSDGGNDSYWEMIFCVTTTENAPYTPANGIAVAPSYTTASGTWYHYADEGNFLWMSQRFVEGTSLGDWTPVVRLGNAGADDGKYEYIYFESSSDSTADLPNWLNSTPDANSKGQTKADNDFIPEGWFDNPQGVTPEKRFEWMSWRVKVNGEWTEFQTPIIMSAYGLRGIDGDGVEYIFYVGTDSSIFTGDLNPANWYTNAQSKADTEHQSYNASEYIKPNTGWTDDAPDVTGSGAVLYVSMRKKRTDNEDLSSEDPQAYWHQYSEPKIWTRNGTDSISAGSVLFDNSTMFVPVIEDTWNTGSEYTNASFRDSTLVYMTQGSHTISLTNLALTEVIVDGEVHTNDAVFTQVSNWLTIANNYSSIGVVIGEHTIPNFKNKIYTLRFTGSAEDLDDRTGTLKIIGMNTGVDGENGHSYKLILGTNVVKVGIGTQTGSYIPGAISPRVLVTNGATAVSNLSVTELANNFVIKYTTDKVAETTLTSNDLEIVNSLASQYIIFRLYINNLLVDEEYVVLLQDGANGLSATKYELIPLSSNVVSQNDRTSGTVTLKAVKTYADYAPVKLNSNYKFPAIIEDNVTIEPEETASLKVTLDSDSLAQSDVQITGDGTITCSINVASSKKYIVAALYKGNSNNVDANQVASILIPIAQGAESSVQTLQQSVLRSVPANKTYYLDGRTSPEQNSDDASQIGIYYQDFVRYTPGDSNNWKQAWGIYLCVKEVINTSFETLFNTNRWSDYFVKMSYDLTSFVNYLVADEAFIGDLTAHQVVITKENGTVVAGMTSGDTVPTEVDATNNDGIRIWAGAISNGDISSAPFSVNSDGHLKAEDADITGNITATSGSFTNGTITNVTVDNATITGVIKANTLYTNVGTFYGTDSNRSVSYTESNLPNIIVARGLVSGSNNRLNCPIIYLPASLEKEGAVVKIIQPKSLYNKTNSTQVAGVQIRTQNNQDFVNPWGTFTVGDKLCLQPAVVPASEGTTDVFFGVDKAYVELCYFNNSITGISGWRIVDYQDVYVLDNNGNASQAALVF